MHKQDTHRHRRKDDVGTDRWVDTMEVTDASLDGFNSVFKTG